MSVLAHLLWNMLISCRKEVTECSPVRVVGDTSQGDQCSRAGPEGHGQTEKWSQKELVKFNKDKCQVLHPVLPETKMHRQSPERSAKTPQKG